MEGVHYEDAADVFRIAPSKEFCPTCPNKLGFEIDYTVCMLRGLITEYCRSSNCFLSSFAQMSTVFNYFVSEVLLFSHFYANSIFSELAFVRVPWIFVHFKIMFQEFELCS